MTAEEIGTKAQQMGEKGIDRLTTLAHFEAVQGRALGADEKRAAEQGWGAGADARAKQRPA